LDVFAEKLQVFRVNPAADVAPSDHDRSRRLEHPVSGNVVQVIVSVDDELEWEGKELASLGEKRLCRGFPLERIDDRNAVVSDDETGIRTGVAFHVVNRRVHAVAKRFESKGQL